MLVGVNAGHTLTGKGTGAIGYLTEGVETRKISEELLRLLGNKGVNLTVDKSSNYLLEVVNKANRVGCDLFISIHLNAGKGKGVEAYTWQGAKVKEAVDIVGGIEKLGFRNRGVKDGSWLYVIRKTTMKAILVEVCFVDTKSDVDQYNKVGYKEIAKAIYKAII